MAGEEPSGILAQISESKKSYELIVQKRNRTIKEAEKRLKSAKNRHEALVKSCEFELEKAEKPFTDPVMKLGSVILFPNKVQMGTDLIYLDKSVKAEVSTSGSIYSETEVKSKGPSIGGAIVGGVVAGGTGAVIGGQRKVKSNSVTHDDRKLFLTISSDSRHLVAELEPSKELEARRLAGQIELAAKGSDGFDAKKDAALKPYREKLQAAKEDVGEVNQLKEELAALEADTSEVDKARADHEAFIAAFDPAIVKAEKKTRNIGIAKKILAIVLLLLGLFNILVGCTGFVVPNGQIVGIIFLLLADFLIVVSTILFRG